MRVEYSKFTIWSGGTSFSGATMSYSSGTSFYASSATEWNYNVYRDRPVYDDTTPKIIYQDRVEYVEVPKTEYIIKEVKVMDYGIGFVVAVLIVVVIYDKVIRPRMTLRNMVRFTFKLIGWPLKKLVQVIREEWNKE